MTATSAPPPPAAPIDHVCGTSARRRTRASGPRNRSPVETCCSAGARSSPRSSSSSLLPFPPASPPKSWRLLAIFLAPSSARSSGPCPPAPSCSSASRPSRSPARSRQPRRSAATPTRSSGSSSARSSFRAAIVKTGLGRRIAFLFIRAIGHRSIGLAYALVGTDTLLASLVPSNGARAGGVVFPVAKSLAEAYDSTPGTDATSARRVSHDDASISATSSPARCSSRDRRRTC